MPQLADQVVIVTGAGRGLGRSIAVALAAEGARLVLVARTRSQLEETAALVRDAGSEALALASDVAAPDAASGAVNASLKHFGRLDALVFGAGVSVTRAALEVTPEDWDHVVGINLKAAFFWSQAAARHMVTRRTGRIVFLSSVTGQVGMPWLAPYSASKAGLAGLTRGLAAEWGANGIRVNAIAAGFVKTELTAAELSDERLVRRIVQRAPLGRLGQPQDVAASAVFLASDASSYISGHVLAVDGGWQAA
ncbi:SDR family NAD(P)-dependent oxidoreductase [Ramlibacter sp.]|uniref:SDR family NAD(P)-dependent oxidoreductase n=1 Tax=Ramlibacter sp. TaxID=1917967 RepID=UPI003D0D2520